MKKKGFTLVELLATVMILAVVAVVATPIVLDVINDATAAANRESVQGLINAANNYYAESWLDDSKKAKIENNEDIYDDIQVGGEKPKEGELYVNSKGQIAIATVMNNTCYIKEAYSSEIKEYKNAEECKVGYVGVDENNPITTITVNGTKGENDWYNSKTTVILKAEDNITENESGIDYIKWCSSNIEDECVLDNRIYSNEKTIEIEDTPGKKVCVEAYDKMGNKSEVKCIELKVDMQAPKIALPKELTVAKDTEVDLKLLASATDEMSGISGEITYTPESIDTKKIGITDVTYTVKDNAGHITSKDITITISADVPTITYTTEEGTFNEHGWAKEDFIVNINVLDNSGHGIKEFKICTITDGDTCNPENGAIITGQTSAIREITEETDNNRICVQATDNYGQTTPVMCSYPYKLDKTAPTAGTINITGTEGKNGWYTSNLAITANAGHDSLSGHNLTEVDIKSITENTEGTKVTVTTTDIAGNVSTREYTIKLDKTIPEVEITEPSINGTNGWYITDTIVSATVSDTYSTPDSLKWCQGDNCTPTEIVSGNTKSVTISDTKGTQFCVVAIDKAGNVSEKKCSNVIKVDKVSPQFSGITDITVSKDTEVDLESGVSVYDATSGIDGEYTYSPTSIDTTKAGVTEVTYKILDKAGNEKTITRKVIVSSSAPTITFTPSAIEKGWANSDYYVTINVKDNSGHGIKEFRLCTATTDTCDPTNGSVVTSATSATREITTESSNNRICVQATDNYNQTSSVICSDAYKLDKTKPTAGTIEVTGTKLENDWYTSNVEITKVDGTDSLSGHLETTVDKDEIKVNGETKVTVTTKDNAGNTSTREYTIKVDKTTPTATITKTVNNNKNVLTAVVTPADTLSGYVYEWYKDGSKIPNATGLSYETTESGTYQFKVTTGSGKVVDSNEITIDGYTITYNLNGGTGSISSTTKVQDVSSALTSTIPTRSGYTFMGWGVSATDTTVDYSSNATYTANENITLYAIWKKTVTVTFVGNGASIDKTSATCDMYNADTNCTVTFPTITREGFTITGFNTDSNATTAQVLSGKTAAVSANTTYYAITSKQITVTFNKNGATAIGSTEQKCTIQNSATTCNITSPSITASSATPTVVGWDSTSSYTSNEWAVNTPKVFSSNATYYAVTKKDAVTYTATFNANGATLSKTSASCTINATYNGTARANSCNVTAPTITRSGYTIIGFNTDSSATTSQVNSGATFAISSNPTYYAITKINYICKRATTLHTETCSQTNSIYYCVGDGYGTGTITFGNIGKNGTLTSGDAFDCDVNGDGVFDSSTERFYYVADLNTNSNYAVLMYYNNTVSGVANNTSSSKIMYDSSGSNNYGPRTAIANLPTTSQWKNVALSSTTRAIKSSSNGTTTSAGTLPTAFSYSGYAARLLTYQELKTACGSDYFDNCTYMIEKTSYSTSGYPLGTWLETPTANSTSYAYILHADFVQAISNYVYVNSSSSSIIGVRPVIEVLKSKIEVTSDTTVDTSISLVNTSGTGYVGGSVITVPVNGNHGTLTCSTGNSSIATCSTSGQFLKVTPGTTAGTTTITVKENTGNKTATYSITVKSTSVNVSPTSGTTTIGGSNLTATISGSNYGKLSCSTSSYSVARCSISGNTLTVTPGTTTGTATITITEANGKKKATYTANIESGYICKRATTLHRPQGVSVGKLGTSGVLSSGDAFDCDVNGDGTYNAETERFYYVTSLAGNTNYAVLLYYNNTYNGVANSTTGVAYHSSDYNYYGPVTAKTHMPTTSQWKNVTLASTTRAILTESGSSTLSYSLGTFNLPTAFSYSGYAARLLTYAEAKEACGVTNFTSSTSAMTGNCSYMLENTKYFSSSNINGFLLETPNTTAINGVGNNVTIVGYPNGSYNFVRAGYTTYGVRPVIEVKKTDMQY